MTLPGDSRKWQTASWLTALWVVSAGSSAIAQVATNQDLASPPSDPPMTETLPLPHPTEQRLPQLQPFPVAPIYPASPALSPLSPAYTLGPGDEISIRVVDYAEFTQTQVILPDGSVTLPLIGSVQAGERTLPSLQREVTRRLSDYLINPVVELALTRLRPMVVTVSGEVYRPGPIQLNSLPRDNTPVPTLSTALVSAGGVRRQADLRSVTVQRRQPNGETAVFTVNLWESLFQGGASNDILLQDKDTVFVPAAPEDAAIDPRLVARSSLAPSEVRVRLIGEVNSPGEIQISPDSTVIEALATAGGHRSDANLRDVALLRLDETGQLVGQNLDLRNLDNNTPIRDGDIIVVPKKGYLNFVDGISRTLQPITSPFNFLLLLDRVFERNN